MAAKRSREVAICEAKLERCEKVMEPRVVRLCHIKRSVEFKVKQGHSRDIRSAKASIQCYTVKTKSI